MFALRRAPLRLAARMPFLRPQHISAGYANQSSSIVNLLQDLTQHNPDSPVPAESSPPGSYSEPSPPQSSPPQSSPPESSAFMSMDSPAPSSLPWDHIPEKGAPAHRFHCHSTKTNTINTFTDPNGNVIAWFSGGSTGFKKRNRSSYEAGYQCAVRMFEKIEATAAEEEKKNPAQQLRVDLFCKGFGQGRDALFKALMTAQGNGVRSRISSLTDRTPIKIGGTRSRKRKRR